MKFVGPGLAPATGVSTFVLDFSGLVQLPALSPGGVRFLDPDGVHRTPEIGEGGPPSR